MSCCSTGAEKFFSRKATTYAWRHRWLGLDRVQKLIAWELHSIGLASRSILEVGCGTGALHLELLKKGASRAVGVDISSEMITRARAFAAHNCFADRTEYHVGDFATLDGEIGPADIVILDKVVCCYESPGLLLAAAAARCSDVCIASYPRDAVMPRMMFRTMEWLGERLGWSFHPYYHEPRVLRGLIEGLGLKRIAERKTIVWQVDVYQKG